MNNKKKIILGSIIGIMIGLLISTTYAIFSYNKIGNNQQLIAGDIYMHYNESNTLTLENALPSSTYDSTKYFEFTIKGKNTNTKYNIVYDINLNYGDEVDNKIRIQDRFLKFRLVEVINNEEQELLNDKSYLSIDNKRIYVSTINKETNDEITKTYRLYVWIDKNVVIGNTDYADYTIENWNNVYGSVKVSVTGDFSEKEIQTEPYLVMKNLYSSGGTDWTNIRGNITSIEFHTDGIVPNDAITSFDITDEASSGDVTLYTIDDGLGNNTYKAVIVGDDIIYAPESCFAMFYNCTNLVTFNSKNFKVDNVNDMSHMFRNNNNLTNINGLANWNTSNVKTMRAMFRVCTSLQDVSGLKNWNVEKVEIMQQMFMGCISLEEIDLSNWKTTSLNDMLCMFGMWNDNGTSRTDSKLKRIILSNKFNTSNVTGTGMATLFANNTMIEDYSFLQYIDISNAGYFTQMFRNNYGLQNEDLEYIKNWNVSNITHMGYMFSGCTNLTNISGLSNWKVSNVTNMDYMFYNCANLADISALSNWNVGKVENMDYMFSRTNISNLNALSNWNTSNVTTMGSMFRSCKNIITLAGLENWNVEKVMNFSEGNDPDGNHSQGMFEGLTSLTDASAINNWNINSNALFDKMFKNTPVHPEFTSVSGIWDSQGTFTPSV